MILFHLVQMTQEIDLLIKNGNILTMDKNQPEAEAIAVSNGIILAVGKNTEILKKYPKAKEVVDLKGKFLCPGFNDAHTHLLGIGAKFQDVMLDKVISVKEALEKLRERVKTTAKGKWVFGERWDESNWVEKRYLTLSELDKIAPENPCFIRRVCGHLAAVNSLALEELGIAKDDPDLDLVSETKEPLGIITVKIMERIGDSPKLKKTQVDFDNAVIVACDNANSLGITSVTDNLSVRAVKSYIKFWKKNELTVRVNMNIPLSKFDQYIETGLKTGYGNKILKFGGVKIFTDGSLGARTASLNEAYFDDSTTKGKFYIEKDIFAQAIRKAVENDWQTATHAIGDAAIELILDTFESIGNDELVAQGRHRIEHAEYLLDDHIRRVKKLGLILSMQPNFPGRWGRPGQLYEIRLGSERYKLLNNFKKIQKSYTKICFGSDNMPMSPLFGIWSVVTHPIDDIRITVEEAIYYFTLGAAFASFEDEIKGSLESGKLADFVVLDKDILNINLDVIKDVQVLMTFFNGKKVYDKSKNK